METFVVFNSRFIVTANRDGTVPLNSKIVAELVDGSVRPDLLTALIDRANREVSGELSEETKTAKSS